MKTPENVVKVCALTEIVSSFKLTHSSKGLFLLFSQQVVNGDQDKQTIRSKLFGIQKQIFDHLKQPVYT
jgi:hypothetical protein